MSVRSFQNKFWCSEEKHGLFLQILEMFGQLIGLCFWFICILAIKNQSVWMVDFLY